jgi:hypothetical protein
MAIYSGSGRRDLPVIQRPRRNIPVEQIIAAEGFNPMAAGIQQVGDTLGQALQRRAALRQQAQQVAALEKVAGQPVGAFTGVPLEVASSLAGTFAKQRLEQEEAEKKKVGNLQKIRLLEQQGKLPAGSLGDDFDAAKLIFTQNAITNRMTENPYLDLAKERQNTQESDKLKNRVNNQKNRMINDPRVKPLYAQDIGLRQVGEVANLVKGGNTVAAGALGVKMAKAMGEVGVLTDQDVSRYVVSGRLDRMAADKLSRWIRGVPSDATQAEIGQIAEVLRDNFSQKMQPIYNEYIEQFAETEGMTPDEVSRKMAIPYIPAMGSALKPIQTKAPAGGGNKIGRFVVEIE